MYLEGKVEQLVGTLHGAMPLAETSSAVGAVRVVGEVVVKGKHSIISDRIRNSARECDFVQLFGTNRMNGTNKKKDGGVLMGHSTPFNSQSSEGLAHTREQKLRSCLLRIHPLSFLTNTILTSSNAPIITISNNNNTNQQQHSFPCK